MAAVVGAGAVALGGAVAWAGLSTTDGTSKSTKATSTVDVAPARFSHPGITFDKADLAGLKHNVKRAPWKGAYASLLSDSRSSLSYTMQGPYAEVGRNPDVHRGAYENDMQAVYNLTLRGYISGDSAYSAKATKIMTAWCATQTKWSGAEAAFTIGDYSILGIAAADTLRGTYSGWTKADTRLCQKNFNDVYWPQLGVGLGANGAGSHLLNANQGSLQLQGAMAIAVFDDDRVKFGEVVDAYLTEPMGGLSDTLPNGEVGDTGRDGGHAYGQWMHLAAVAETAWKQGVDLYSAKGDRLLKAAEYFSRYNLGGNPEFTRFGSGYALYSSIASDDDGTRWVSNAGAPGLDLVYNAYVVRMHRTAPYTARLRAKVGQIANSMIYDRTGDASRATRTPTAWTAPTASQAVNTPKSADVGNVGSPGSTTHRDGSWTLTSYGQDQTSGYHYAYRTVTGDATLIAHVASAIGGTDHSETGLMIRSAVNTSSDVPYVFQRLLGDGSVETEWGSKGTGNSWSHWDNLPDVKAPYWLKIVRRGSYVYTYTSPTGANWSPNASVLLTGLPDTVRLGLAVASGSTTEPTTAVFDHVKLGTAAVSSPAAPNRPTATKTSGRITLHWKAAARAVSYTVLRATGNGAYKVVAEDLIGTRYTDTTTRSGITYRYTVRAAGYSGYGPKSRTVAVTR
ncbi:alginate lyase family protein [Streptomyces sp. NPDC058464]|uniref:alginate lyase family protein n=1 Tax=Streptomyces sp. NPDC058464 TaxID=3346511 RepID=UPI003668ED15